MFRRPTALTVLTLATAFAAWPRPTSAVQAPAPTSPAPAPTQLPVPGPDSSMPGSPLGDEAPDDLESAGGVGDPFGTLEPVPSAPNPIAPSPAADWPDAPAPVDPQVLPAQDTPAVEMPDLGEAIERPGTAAVPSNAPAGKPFVLRPSDIKPGPNTVNVTVEVRAPEVANLNRDGAFDIIVRNEGNSEATNVRVRYPLPPNLQFLSSEPVSLGLADGDYTWQINSLPPKSQKVIKVDVRFLAEGEFDHAVTVHLQAGARTRTLARKPELKLEVRPDRPEILKGNRVAFNITVSNNGTYPAENVVVLAELPPGLEHPSGKALELPLRDAGFGVLESEKSAGPLRLEVLAKADGPQTVKVSVTSADTTESVTETTTIQVVEPRLEANFDGPATRFPGTKGTYVLTVQNTGTAPAHDILAAIKVPDGGTPYNPKPAGFRWDRAKRTIWWQLDRELPPGAATEPFSVEVEMGGVGTLPVMGGVRARDVDVIMIPRSTRIEGLPDIQCEVAESKGVLDIGDETIYRITLVNKGSKDATNLAVTATLSSQLQVLSVAGSGSGATSETEQTPTDGKAVLPLVPRLAPGGEVELTVRAKAVEGGQGTFQVEIMHEDLKSPVIIRSVVTRVTE